MTNKIRVELGSKSYDIIVESGAISYLDKFIISNNYHKIFIITDENVAKIHLETVTNSISSKKVEQIIIQNGERNKNFDTLEMICEKILEKNIDRQSLIIALGGGVIGDISGFAASILLRGIDFIQIPTTLLAAVDSSVGGKTAINSISGKNLIGSFYQPKLVLCDLNFIKTIPTREFKAGYAEALKYGLIRDCNFFEFLDKNHQKIFDFEENYVKEIIIKSCKIKAEIVSLDEKEFSVRALLNFGHTFGHCLEAETNYLDILNHGEAVAIGMLMATKMSVNLGYISEEKYTKIKNHYQKCNLKTNFTDIIPSASSESLRKHLFKDKKIESGNLTFILLNDIGSSLIKKTVDVEEFNKVIDFFKRNFS